MGRHRKTRREKNIKKDDYTDEWLVLKRFKQFKEPHIYGRFQTFREAKKYRDQLDKNDAWKDSLPEHKKHQLLQHGKNYTQIKNGNCYIYKTHNYIQHFYGRYANKKDAELVVYHLIRNNWDFDSIPEEVKKLRLPSDIKNKRYLERRNELGHVIVRRQIKGVNYNYGAYPSKAEAEKVISYLNKHGWGKELPPELEKLQVTKRKPKHYSKTSSGSYNVHKAKDGKARHYGSYATEEDAQNAVMELEKHNWSISWFNRNKEKLKAKPRYNQKGADTYA